eukprot:Skav202766  [mRNA]  locus=scaffold326:241030:242835:- [translate_table: standard]
MRLHCTIHAELCRQRLAHHCDLRVDAIGLEFDDLAIAPQGFTGRTLPSATDASIEGTHLRYKGTQVAHGVIAPGVAPVSTSIIIFLIFLAGPKAGPQHVEILQIGHDAMVL